MLLKVCSSTIVDLKIQLYKILAETTWYQYVSITKDL